MFDALILLITLLCACGEVKSQACATTSTTSKDIYEHSPVDTEASLFGYAGTPGTNINLVLTGELTSAFNLTGEKLVVADPTRLDRSSYPITSGRDGYDIPGVVTCYEIGSTGPGISNSISVYMRYINKIPPKITSANSVQPEYIPEGTQVLTVEKENSEEDDFELFEYSITEQTPPGFFEIDSSSGVVTLIKNLNYQEYAQHVLDVELKNIGKDSAGGNLTFTDEQTITITVEDYDDLLPVFQPCDGEVCSPLYTLNIPPNDAIPVIDIQPAPIKAVDGDKGINTTVNYEFDNGIPADYDDYFEIDSLTGAVGLRKAFDHPALYTIAVKATQESNAGRFAVTHLQVDVSREDNFKPSFADTSFSGSVLDNGDPIIFVYKDGSEELLQLTATDDDDSDALLIYTFTESTAYQISNDGYIFLKKADAASRSTVSDTTLKIRAININADSRSPNRESDEIAVTVTVTEIQVDMVPASTLYGVAAGLSTVLFLAILVIMYLHRKYKNDIKSILDDKERQLTQQNVAYTEEDENYTTNLDYDPVIEDENPYETIAETER